MTEQIKILESFKETFSGTDNINTIDIAIRSLEAWSEVLNELKNMREIIWQDTDDERRIVRANAWDKIEILNKAIDIIKEKLSEVEK